MYKTYCVFFKTSYPKPIEVNSTVAAVKNAVEIDGFLTIQYWKNRKKLAHALRDKKV